MKKRPEHATDCPACDGWIGGADLLCMQCSDRVCKDHAQLVRDWLDARARSASAPSVEHLAREAYRRGLVVGTAMLLFQKRWQPGRAKARTTNTKGASS